MKIRLQYHWPWIIWLLIVFLLTGLPGTSFPNIISFSDWLKPDKVVHLLLFGIFVFLFARGLTKQYPTSNSRYIIISSLIIGIFAGGLTELMQKFVFIGRNGNMYDFYADVIGCIIGILVFKFVFRKKKHEFLRKLKNY